MRALIFIAGALAVLPSPALGQPGGAGTNTALAKPGGTCAGLKTLWANIEMEMASIEAEGVVDNSAPRATLRATETANELAKAQMVLDLMIAQKCSLPDGPPSYIYYTLDAMKCRAEQLKGNYKAEECKRANWKRLGTQDAEKPSP